MDTSDEYIKMCDCSEIQKQKGDDGHSYFKFVLGKGDDWRNDRNVWLPRQDQIQKMIGSYPLLYFLQMLYLKFKPGFEAKSFEQLWLAFYMLEKHKKIWQKDKWINVNTTE